MLKTYLFAIVLLFLFVPGGFANTSQNERRIEEVKRQKLRSSEMLETGPIDEGVLSQKKHYQYFKLLLEKKEATMGDLTQTLVILLGKADEYNDFEKQRKLVIEQKWMPDRMVDHFEKEALLRKGEAAYVFCKVLGIKGGLNLRVFGMSERYALKELIYQGISSGGSKHEVIAGNELVFMMVQSVEYLAGQASSH